MLQPFKTSDIGKVARSQGSKSHWTTNIYKMRLTCASESSRAVIYLDSPQSVLYPFVKIEETTSIKSSFGSAFKTSTEPTLFLQILLRRKDLRRIQTIYPYQNTRVTNNPSFYNRNRYYPYGRSWNCRLSASNSHGKFKSTTAYRRRYSLTYQA